MTNYEVTVTTGNIQYGGTDAWVYVTLYGTKGNGSPTVLDDPSRNDFEIAQRDKFVLKQDDLGDIKGLQIRHDDSGNGSGWFIDKIVVKNMSTGSSKPFPCGRWLASDEEDYCTYRFLGEIPNDIPIAGKLKSRLATGRWMETSARLSRGTNQLTARTHTWTNNEFTGFTGAVAILYIDERGDMLGGSEGRTYGVNGLWIPGAPSSRDEHWNEQVNPDIARKTRSLAILHWHNPSGFGRWRDIWDEFVESTKKIAQAGKEIRAAFG